MIRVVGGVFLFIDISWFTTDTIWSLNGTELKMMFPLKCKNLIKDFSHNLNITRMFGHQYNTFQPINKFI